MSTAQKLRISGFISMLLAQNLRVMQTLNPASQIEFNFNMSLILSTFTLNLSTYTLNHIY